MKPGLEPLTERLSKLPLDFRGYPVPWFVATIDGKPDFRVSDPAKWTCAIKENRCWVCGDKMGAFKTFVVGPMCGINRVTFEPPCHLECAQWSARNCPFLANPNMVRNEHKLQGENPAGIMLKRNPGVCLLWTTKTYKPVRVDNGYLLSLGDPISVSFYAKGRTATDEEIIEAIDSGYPSLLEMALEDDKRRGDQKATIELSRAKENFMTLVQTTQTKGNEHANQNL